MIHKFSLILLFLLLGFAACNHKGKNPHPIASITITDRNGFQETISNTDRIDKYQTVDWLQNQPFQTVLRVFERDSQGNLYAILTSYHPNGQPHQYLDIMNGRAHGCYNQWHPNGTLAVQVEVLEGEVDLNPTSQQTWIFNGEARAYDGEGNLAAVIQYKKGSLEGESFYYHPSGAVWKVFSYKNGQLDGSATLLLADGTLLEQSEYREGVRHGETKRVWTGGQEATSETYDQGLLVRGSYYSPNGDLVSQVTFGQGYRAVCGKDDFIEFQEISSGAPNGEVRVLNSDGQICQIYHVKDGIKHGLDTEFYPHGDGTLPRILTEWVDGQLSGSTKTWYPDGTLESQREVHNDRKHGVLTAWYKTGQIMMIEEYEKDLLMRGEYFAPGESLPTTRIDKGDGVAMIHNQEGHLLQKVTYQNGKPTI